MSRNEGFVVADVATSKHNDPKFRALWRLLRDEQAMNAAVVLYEAVQLSSWQQGERISAEDAAPVWMLEVDKPAAALVEVSLLDREFRIPEKSWNSWFGPAAERRHNLREKWIRANRNRRNPKGTTAGTPQTPSGDNGGTAAPVRPSVRPSVPSVPSNKQAAPYSAPRAEKNGSIERDDARLVAYRLKAADASLSEDVRRAAQVEVERLENHVH